MTDEFLEHKIENLEDLSYFGLNTDYFIIQINKYHNFLETFNEFNEFISNSTFFYIDKNEQKANIILKFENESQFSSNLKKIFTYIQQNNQIKEKGIQIALYLSSKDFSEIKDKCSIENEDFTPVHTTEPVNDDNIAKDQAFIQESSSDNLVTNNSNKDKNEEIIMDDDNSNSEEGEEQDLLFLLNDGVSESWGPALIEYKIQTNSIENQLGMFKNPLVIPEYIPYLPSDIGKFKLLYQFPKVSQEDLEDIVSTRSLFDI